MTRVAITTTSTCAGSPITRTLVLVLPSYKARRQHRCCSTYPWRLSCPCWSCVSHINLLHGHNSYDTFTVTYRYRALILPHVPERMRFMFPKLSNYTPLATFSDQVDAGMSSSAFDIEANIRDGDSRAGLDERGTQEVLEIMRRERVKYDVIPPSDGRNIC